MRQCLTIWAVFAVLLLNTSCAWAQPPDREGHFPFYRKHRGELPSPLTTEEEKQYPASIRNPGFEIPTAGGDPADWELAGDPELRSESDGITTNHFVHCSRSHRYHQPIAFPVGQWQTIALLSRVKGEMGVERPSYSFQVGSNWYARPRVTDDELTNWRPFYGTLTRPAGATAFRVFLESRGPAEWVDYDDLEMLDEGTGGGDFDSAVIYDRWSLTGGATITEEKPLRGTGSLLLPPGGMAQCVVAHTPYVAQYFLTGIAQGPFSVAEIRMDTAGNPVTSPTLHAYNLAEPGRFLLELPRSEEAVAATLRFTNSDSTASTLDELSRGWAYAFPEVVEPVANSTRPTVRLAAAWPDKLDTAEIAIIDSGGTERARLQSLQRDGSSAWIDYGAAGLAPGVYTARFFLRDSQADEITVDRTFTVVIGPNYPERPMAFRLPDYSRIPWIFMPPYTELDDLQTVGEYVERLQQVKDDGFNLMLIVAETSQYPLLKPALDEVGVPYMLYNPTIARELLTDVGNQTWDAATAMRRFDAYAPFFGSPLFTALYIYDEPNVGGDVYTQRTRQLMIQMERDGRFPPAVTTLNPFGSTMQVPLTIASTYEYPVRTSRPTGPQQIEYLSGIFERLTPFAVANDLNFWAGMQGYATGAATNTPTYAETMAQLGTTLAVGSRGYFTFIYGPLAGSSAPLTFDYQPKRRTAAFRDFNTRMEVINPGYMQLETGRETPPQENLFARVAHDRNGDAYALITNWNTEGRLTLSVYTDKPARLQNFETGDYLTDDDATTHSAVLEPGDWAIYAVDNGAEPTNFTGQVEDLHIGGAADVPVLAMFQAGTSLPRISIRPDGRHLAAVGGGHLTVFSLDGATLGNPVFDQTILPGETRVRYIDNTHLLYSNESFGLRLFEQDGDTLTPVYTLERGSGNAFDALPDGDDLWVAQSYWGVALMHPQGETGFHRLGHFFSEEFDFIRVFGPYGNAVIGLEDVRGLYRFTRTADGIEGARLQSDRTLYTRATQSPGGRLALAELDQGVRVIDLDADGNLVHEVRINDERLNDAEHVAWLSEDTLAVGDTRRGVFFYRVGAEGNWRSQGLWEPAPRPFIISALDSLADGRFVVSLSDGTVLIADGTGAVNDGRQTGWMTY